METDRLKILLIEDNEGDYVLVRDTISEFPHSRHLIERVTTHGDALDRIGRGEHDIYLLGCRPGDSSGLDLLREAGAESCPAPFILLAERYDSAFKGRAMEAGASGCLFKGDIGVPFLEHAIRCAVELKKIREELRAGDERFRQLAENINMVFWITSVEGDRIIYINRTFETIWGIPLETLYRHPGCWLDALHPEDRDLAPNAAGGRHHVEFKAFEYRIERPDRSIRWIRDRFFPVRNPAGEVHRIARISEDVTEEKRLRKEAEYHLQQIVHADKMASLGEVVAGVAHEINNPNSFITYNVPLLEETWNAFEPIISEYAAAHPRWKKGAMSLGEFRDEMGEIIEAIKIGSDRIARVVSNLKGFARTEEGIPARPVQVNEVVENTLTIVGAQLRKQASQVDVNLSKNLPAVEGHPQKLEQVVANLLLNAAHALPARDGGKISISTRYVKRLRCILIEIEDNGEGIKPEVMGRIFEPFFTTRRASGGTGLGLSVSYGLIKEHGGIIGALSRPWLGSRFTAYLPVERGAEVRLSPIILCVDDNQAFLNMLRTIFIKVNTGIEVLENAEGVLAYLEEHPEVDVVLSDLVMPRMDGWELLAKVKARFPLVPFILYTGSPDALRGKPEGSPAPDYFLRKPFTVQHLIRIVDSMGRQRL